MSLDPHTPLGKLATAAADILEAVAACVRASLATEPASAPPAGGEPVALPAGDQPPTPPPATPPATPNPHVPSLNKIQARILDILADGIPRRTKELGSELYRDRSRTQRELRELLRRGLIVQDEEFGPYRLPGTTPPEGV